MTQLDLYGAGEISPAPAAPVAAAVVRPLVVLVGCGAKKARSTSRAKDLYLGNLFRAARGHAEQLGATWRILSARFGILKPEQRIKPYEQRMFRRELERTQWGISAATSLTYEMGGNGFDVLVLAGEDYAEPICRVLEARGIRCDRPLRGLGIGERLAWFKAQREGVQS